MSRRLFQKFLLVLTTGCCLFLFSGQRCQAQELANLKTFTLTKIEKKLQIHIEHSSPPRIYYVDDSEYPRRLVIEIVGARITFRPYENIPIEIPVSQKGIKRILVEEDTDYRRTPPESVFVTIEATQPFLYNIDAQWNGQFMDILFSPEQGLIETATAIPAETTEMASSKRLDKIKKLKELESQKARERLQVFTQQKRVELIRKESKERLSSVKKRAEERIDSARTIEKAYKKLKAETEVGSMSVVREQMSDPQIYKGITMPSEIKPVLRRVPKPTTQITSLEDCINLAVSKHIPMLIAKEQEKLARLRVREARRAFYPAFLGEWNEVDGNTVTEPYRGRSYGLQAEQVLFSGGKLTATLRKEQLGESIAKGNFERVKLDLLFQVTKAYYELVLAKNVLDATKRLKHKEQQLLSEIEKEYAIQSATPSELLSAQATYNQACYQVAFSERSFTLAKLSLEKEMFAEGLDVEGLNYHLKRKKLNAKLEQCLEIAFKNRQELRVLEKTIEAAKYSQDIIKSEEFPNLSLSGSYGRSGESFSQRDLNLATEWKIMGKVKWFLGGNTVETSYTKDKVSPFRVTKTDTNIDSQTLNAKFSFWDNLAHFTKDKEAYITRKQAEKDLEEMKNKIRQETEDAYYSFQRYNTQLALAINEIGFRRKQVEIVKTKRKMYEATAADVMESELQLSQSDASLQEALSGINVAIASLNRAVGVINYFN
ncbi:MAG: TolC family protein [Candidatus Omnitrophica bacterium]|nr:TolC family protein [Candidatus Omnitrophota bacterium]